MGDMVSILAWSGSRNIRPLEGLSASGFEGLERKAGSGKKGENLNPEP